MGQPHLGGFGKQTRPPAPRPRRAVLYRGCQRGHPVLPCSGPGGAGALVPKELRGPQGFEPPEGHDPAVMLHMRPAEKSPVARSSPQLCKVWWTPYSAV